MGAMDSLVLLRRAKQIVFGVASVPEDTEQRRELLRQIDYNSYGPQLDELDRLFWEDPDKLSERAQLFAHRNALL
jgi:hypothetical protein